MTMNPYDRSVQIFRTNVTQYLQDIYRFFKLSPYKKEFEDIFSGKLDIYNSEFFRMTAMLRKQKPDLPITFFSRNFYDDALNLFLKQVNDKPDDAQLYEKIAYCYQENGDWDEALKYYRRAEIIDRKAWTIKKIGLCLRRQANMRRRLNTICRPQTLSPEIFIL